MNLKASKFDKLLLLYMPATAYYQEVFLSTNLIEHEKHIERRWIFTYARSLQEGSKLRYANIRL